MNDRMDSFLIKNTTREERERIVAESIGNISGSCDGCAAGVAEMYQDYIDGKKEISDINMEFSSRYEYKAGVPKKNTMILNESAKKKFDFSLIDEIPPIDEYPIWKKSDPYGRSYYGVSDFYGMDKSIDKDCDLSWLEWDGNEVYIDSVKRDDAALLFCKTVGIMKSWETQLKKDFPNEHFAIFAYFADAFDNGSESDDDFIPHISFTMRFWKIREGQGFNENTDSNNPSLKLII